MTSTSARICSILQPQNSITPMIFFLKVSFDHVSLVLLRQWIGILITKSEKRGNFHNAHLVLFVYSWLASTHFQRITHYIVRRLSSITRSQRSHYYRSYWNTRLVATRTQPYLHAVSAYQPGYYHKSILFVSFIISELADSLTVVSCQSVTHWN